MGRFLWRMQLQKCMDLHNKFTFHSNFPKMRPIILVPVSNIKQDGSLQGFGAILESQNDYKVTSRTTLLAVKSMRSLGNF